MLGMPPDDEEDEDVEELLRRLRSERLLEQEISRQQRREQSAASRDAVVEAHTAEAACSSAEDEWSIIAARAEARHPAMDNAQAESEALADTVIDQLERDFTQGDHAAHLARWQKITTSPTPTTEPMIKELADVLTLVVASSGSFTCQILLLMRLSRATTAAVHEALGHITAISITDLNVACARTLATFCTGLRTLDMSLLEWGLAEHEQFDRPVTRLTFRQSQTDQQTQVGILLPSMLMRSTPWWLAARGADALLELFASNPMLTEVRGSHLTWNVEAGPHGFEPMGFWDDWTGDWTLRSNDQSSGVVRVRLGLSDVGLSHLSGLRVLQLAGCQCVTDTGLVGICQRSPGLRELDLGKCSGITDATIVAAAHHCSLLEIVDLQRRIPDPGRSCLSTHGPEITVSGFEALVHGCSDLRQLNLVGQSALIGDRNQLFSATPEGATAVGALVDTLIARGVRLNIGLTRSQMEEALVAVQVDDDDDNNGDEVEE